MICIYYIIILIYLQLARFKKNQQLILTKYILIIPTSMIFPNILLK